MNEPQKLTEMQVSILTDAILDNAKSSKSAYTSAIKNTNESSDKLSNEIGFLTSIAIGFIAIILDKLSPTNNEQKIILVIYIFSLLLSLLLGLANKYIVYNFFKDGLPILKRFSKLWHETRNKITGDNTKLINAYTKAVEEDTQISLEQSKRPESSAKWAFNLQLIFSITGFTFLTIYLLFKII